MLLDTTFLIDLMRNDSSATAKARQLAEDSVSIMVGTPSIFELYVGVGVAVKSAEEREKVLSVLKSLTQLSLDSQSATRAGIIYAQKKKEGMQIDPTDAMLAGIAVENHQPLMTRNKRHFSGIPDLNVESY